ncbi:MAG TPA: hypothetical protein VKZ50_02630 [bacterium]|nr:hypothetical protein [bacterium]
MPQLATPAHRRLVETAYLYQTLSLGSLGAARMSWEEITRSLRRHSQQAALTFLATVDATLENDGELAPDTQAELTAALIPEDLRLAATEKLRHSRVVAFANQPIWILEKLALLYADPVAEAAVTEMEMRDLGRLLLAIADHLDDLTPADRPGDRDWMLLQHLLRMEMLHARENAGAALQRVWAMLVDLLGDPALWAEHRADLSDLMERHDGLDIKTYLAAGSALIVHYGQLSLRNRVKPLLMLSPRAYFAAANFTPDVWDRICAVASLSADEYAVRLRHEHVRTESIAFGFRTMREFPLVRYGDKILPLSLRFLREKFTTGLLWRLRDHGRASGIDVPPFLGELFEEYVYRKLAAAHSSGTLTPLAPRVHREVPYRWHKRALCKSSDVTIDCGDRLVMVEAAVGGPRLEETQIRAARHEVERDVEKIVVHNARQLDRNIQALLAGKYQLPGVDPSRIRRIYPVIVTLGSMPDGDLVWHEYETALRGAHLLRSTELGRDVARLQLLTAEEIELLRHLIPQGLSLADILERKDEESMRNMGFKNFLFRIMRDRVHRATTLADQELERVRKEIVKLVFPPAG